MESLLALLSLLPENAAGTYGSDIDGLLSLVTYIITPWVILTYGLVILFCILYRKRSGGRGLYVNSHETLFHIGNIPIPRTAIIEIPTLCVLGLDLWIFASSVAVWGDIKINQPEDPYTNVQVVAEQFGWTFYYPGENGELDTTIERNIRRGKVDGQIRSRRIVNVKDGDDEKQTIMCIPKGKKIGLKITSKDVIHSFFVPNLRFKQDAVPGRNIRGWLIAEKLTRPKFREERVVDHLQSVISLLEEKSKENSKNLRDELTGVCEKLVQDRGVPDYEGIQGQLEGYEEKTKKRLSGAQDTKEVTEAFSSSNAILNGILQDQNEYGGFYEAQSYTIACAELCGYGHSGMTGSIVVMPPDVFDRYLKDEIND